MSKGLLFLSTLLLLPGASRLERPTPEEIDFARDIRPIFEKSCVKCHGGVRRKGGLSLLTRPRALAPGESGKPAVVPGKPAESELIRRVTADPGKLRMPKGGPPLSAGEIDRLKRWIAAGADWPPHWAFRQKERPDLPEVKSPERVRNPIDRFVLARLEDEGIKPSPEADRTTLIRRLSLDLLGLTPGVEEVDAFLGDASPRAYERLVDRLLASPRFGERWARHWLDLARYADSDGYEVDNPRPLAWHWRDWVIEAINRDVPYDQFTVEQLAGDLLPNATREQRLATAFHRQTLTNKESGIDKEEYRVKAVVDRVSTTSLVWLGLTVGCAQCHDHPYDPVEQREFYRLFAFFNNADEADLRLPGSEEEMARYREKKERHAQELKGLREKLKTAKGKAASDIDRRIKALEKKPPRDPSPALHVIARRKQPRETHILDRGDHRRPKKDETLAPGTPATLGSLEPRRDGPPADRLDLAHWLMDPRNPLTARVAVNRFWMHLFGRGLVRTPGDFGVRGEPPAHPGLLDWLADEFIRGGWSRKSMIRLIVTSAAYRQSSRHRPDLAGRDPTNRLVHRQNRFRVEAEIVRDIHLSASGLLVDRIGGPGVFPPISKDLIKITFRSRLPWKTSVGADRHRRGMYTFYKRSVPHPNLSTFDCPDAGATSVARDISNTPVQALATLNNEVFVEAAQALARRVLSSRFQADADRLDYAFRLCVARHPGKTEIGRLTEFLKTARAWYRQNPAEAEKMTGAYGSEKVSHAESAAWTAVANVLLNLDEFLTRE